MGELYSIPAVCTKYSLIPISSPVHHHLWGNFTLYQLFVPSTLLSLYLPQYITIYGGTLLYTSCLYQVLSYPYIFPRTSPFMGELYSIPAVCTKYSLIPISSPVHHHLWGNFTLY